MLLHCLYRYRDDDQSINVVVDHMLMKTTSPTGLVLPISVQIVANTAL